MEILCDKRGSSLLASFEAICLRDVDADYVTLKFSIALPSQRRITKKQCFQKRTSFKKLDLSFELTRPTSTNFSTIPTVRCPDSFPHTKLFNETDGYLLNDNMYMEISFSNPPALTPTQSSLLFPFP